jgi:hypothetical protein
VNGVVQARPAALTAFEEHARDVDLRVAERLDRAREVVARYLASCDGPYVEDPTAILSDVDRALEDRIATAAAIGDLGRAFAALDRPGWAVVTSDEHRLQNALVDGSGLPDDLTTWLVRDHRQRWEELLAGVPGGRCPVFAAGSYGGGGFLRGPDGELYPLVVPQVLMGDEVRNAAGKDLTWAEVEALRGADEGWVDVARHTGTTRFGPEPSVVFRILAAMAGTNPNLLPTTRPVPRQALDALGFGERGLTGVAAVPRSSTLEAPPPAPEGIQHGPPAPGSDLMGEAGARSRVGRGLEQAGGGSGVAAGGAVAADHAAGRHRLRTARGAQARAHVATSGVDALVTLGESLSLASSMRDHGLAHVDVRFQRTPDGRRRAIARSVTGRTGAHGTVLRPTYLTVDAAARLRPVPMRADPHLTMGDPERPLIVDWGQHRDAPPRG